jgi:aminoglycoside phosphotransferase (APT) family kinase protein
VDEAGTRDAEARLTAVRDEVRVPLDGAVLTESWSNDTWITDAAVLRVCWRGDRTRLLREQALLAALPAEIPHAEPLASGQTGAAGELTWLLLRRIPGGRLDLTWPDLTRDQRKQAVLALAHALDALHRWTPPPAITSILRQAATAGYDTPAEIGGAAVVPLPVSTLGPLLDRLAVLPGMDPDLARRVRARLDRLAGVVEDTELTDGVIVHADAHLANLLWHEDRVTALLDFEWARTGPADLEFEAILRDNATLETHAALRPCHASEVRVLAWLREGYPELFAHPDLTKRLWLYELIYQVRQLTAPWIEELAPRQLGRLRILADHPRVQFS